MSDEKKASGLNVIGNASGGDATDAADREFLEAPRQISTPEFLRAVLENEREEVAKMIVHDERLVKSRDASGATAILLAVYHGLDEMAELLLRSEVPLDAFEAAATGRHERLRELVASDAGLLDPTNEAARSGDGFTVLHLACYFGQAGTVDALVELADEATFAALLAAEAENHSRVLPLHSAAACRDADASLAIARRLLETGADLGLGTEQVDAEQAGGFRPLHQAASAGHAELVDLLLAHGADPAAEADLGQTAAELAREKGHDGLADRLAAR